MAHYAYVDENNIVTQVIVGREEWEEGIDWESYYGAIRTSYNTQAGIHYDPTTQQPSLDQSKSFRYNYAGIGYTFDPDMGEHGAFIPPQPYPSWMLDDNANWQPPVPYPAEGIHSWDEDAQEWQPVGDE